MQKDPNRDETVAWHISSGYKAIEATMTMMSFPAVFTLLLLLARAGLTLGLVPPRPENAKVEWNDSIEKHSQSQSKRENHRNLGVSPTTSTSTTRRRALLTGFSSVTATAVACGWISPRDAYAFPNKISSKYDDRPKRRGPKPKDLGLATRTTLEGDEYLGLKQCGPAPNCFSSTMTVEEDPDRSIPAWTWPKALGDDQAKAFQELKEVIEAYTPGQNGVDAGGFEIQTFDPTKGYLYVQFEALKNGYIDDVEFAVVNDQLLGDRAVQVRSSSRVGYLDYGVNAKRLNFIANALRTKGWDAQGVNFETHRGYALENQI
jgi:uncharacterized protein (DUF1499 family)